MSWLKGEYRHYFYVLLTLIVLLSLPSRLTTLIRGAAVSVLSVAWSPIDSSTSWIGGWWPTKENSTWNASSSVLEELARLRLENAQLRAEMENILDVSIYQQRIEDRLLSLLNLVKEKENLPELFHTHFKGVKRLLQMQLQAVPAKVIFRDPSFWNSSLWVNVGEQDNKRLDYLVIAKDSPVLVGTSIVGVIDYVGERQSRVRLITDPGLHPSVRALRGNPQNVLLKEHVAAVIEALSTRQDLIVSQEEDLQEVKRSLLEGLEELRTHLLHNQEEWALAKGVLEGSHQSLWRSPEKILRGVGFNYDFPDDRGPARDLRTGKAFGGDANIPTTNPILRVNDLLVTTGMDGVFPAGLRVAEVVKIASLKEGSYTYELEARPTASNLDSLHTVFVLPPLGYNRFDQPE